MKKLFLFLFCSFFFVTSAHALSPAFPSALPLPKLPLNSPVVNSEASNQISPLNRTTPQNTSQTNVPQLPTPSTSMNIIFKLGTSSYTINNTSKPMDVEPYTKNGRLFLPLRFVGEALGATVSFVDSDKSIRLYKPNDNITLELRIGSPEITVSNSKSGTKKIQMDVYPEITNDRTMLPLRFIAESLGLSVQWDETNQSATLSTAYSILKN